MLIGQTPIFLGCKTWQHGRGRVPGMNRSNASEKIDSFPGRLAFFATLCYFSVRFVWKYYVYFLYKSLDHSSLFVIGNVNCSSVYLID